MKKIFFITTFIFGFALLPNLSFAQGMPVLRPSTLLGINSTEGMGFSSSSPDSATIQSQQQEEQEGKKFLDNLKNKTVTCSQLKDADFEKIGEYFMGQSIGDTSRHISMNGMMKRMMSDKGEEQIHTAWGKRGSACLPAGRVSDTSAAFSSQGAGFIPMMQMMRGGGNPAPALSGVAGMGGWNGFGLLGWIPMLLFWILLILGIVALVRYLGGSTRSSAKGNHLWIFSKSATPRARSTKKSLSR